PRNFPTLVRTAAGGPMPRNRASARSPRAPRRREAPRSPVPACGCGNMQRAGDPCRSVFFRAGMNATENVTTQPPVLAGAHVRLEPLSGAHVAGLVAAAAQDPSLYDWSAIPQGEPAMRAYVDAALAER